MKPPRRTRRSAPKLPKRLTGIVDYDAIAIAEPTWPAAIGELLRAHWVRNGTTVDLDDLAREAGRLAQAWSDAGKEKLGRYPRRPAPPNLPTDEIETGTLTEAKIPGDSNPAPGA